MQALQRMQENVRAGTATRQAGRSTARRIIQAAHDLLETQILDKFSMRSVAEQAGVSLANLQYYFPRREDLLHALFADIAEQYSQAYAAFQNEGDEQSPLERFEQILRYNLEDISRQQTRQFFLQLWALAGSMDGFRGIYLEDLYQYDIEQLSAHIQALHSNPLSDATIRLKATQIAAMIEGMMVVSGDLQKDHASKAALINSCFETAITIALST